MCTIPRVLWTVTPLVAPRPWIVCGGCGGLKPFQSSGKIRLNANGKKLDAWLIYKCLDCDRTWNRPIFERRAVREIDPAVLEALQSNDPEWARLQAFDTEALRRKAQRIDEFDEVVVHKTVLGKSRGSPNSLEIELVVPVRTSIRLDRLLALQLGLSRSRLQALHGDKQLRIAPDSKDILRHRIRDVTLITLNLPTEAITAAVERAYE